MCVELGICVTNPFSQPIGLIVCDSEDCDDFEFVFKSIKKFEQNDMPRFLIANGSDSITNGFESGMGINININISLEYLQDEKLKKHSGWAEYIRGQLVSNQYQRN